MKKWYYLVKGQKQGPLDGIYISELVAAGVIRAGTPIRAEHSADWIEFRESELSGEDILCRTINHLEHNREYTYEIEQKYNFQSFITSVDPSKMIYCAA